MRRRQSLRAGVLLLVIAFLACRPEAGQAQVTVRLEPSSSTVNVGDAFDMQLRADLGGPVLGWGLDLAFDSSVVAKSAQPTIGPAWEAVYASDGDGLAGLAFPYALTGNDVLLATLHFTALSLGPANLAISLSPGDLMEGFPLDPTGIASVQFVPASVTVVPEPASVLLLLGGAMWRRGRRERRS